MTAALHTVPVPEDSGPSQEDLVELNRLAPFAPTFHADGLLWNPSMGGDDDADFVTGVKHAQHAIDTARWLDQFGEGGGLKFIGDVLLDLTRSGQHRPIERGFLLRIASLAKAGSLN